jgi:uncharacterized HhH-GPD family protein
LWPQVETSPARVAKRWSRRRAKTSSGLLHSPGRMPTLVAMALHITGDREADALITREPLALLIGMVLDQQVPLEWAFSGPKELKDRLGGKLDAKTIASMDPAELAEAFTKKPALHRYPASMAKRVQEMCRVIADSYLGDAKRLWTGAKTGKELLSRVRELPGFGEQKAKIFVALLGKQLGVRPSGWEAVSAPFSDVGSTRSVADIFDSQSLATVRAFKQQLKLQSRQLGQPKQAGPSKQPGRKTQLGQRRKPRQPQRQKSS